MTELMQMILDTVAEVTEVEAGKITSMSRKEDVCLSRKIFVDLCVKYGFSTPAIKTALKRSERSVRQIYTSSIGVNVRTLYGVFTETIKKKLDSKVKPIVGHF